MRGDEEVTEHVLAQARGEGAHRINGDDEDEAVALSGGASPEWRKTRAFPALRQPREKMEVSKGNRTPRRRRRV